MIKRKLIKNANKVDKFLINYLKKQKKSLLVRPMKYGVISGGKKIRSTIIFDFGKIFNLSEKKLINICAAVECIHSYSLINSEQLFSITTSMSSSLLEVCHFELN